VTMHRSVVLLAVFVPPAIALAAAPGRDPIATRYSSVLIKDVPHILQKPDFCGEACVAMYLQKLGRRVDQNDVFNQSGLDPLEGRGCHTKELAAALIHLGFQPGPTWYRITLEKAAEQIEAQWKALHGDLAAGVPSIVCMHYDGSPRAPEHFRLVLGYEAATDAVIYHEPAEPGGAYRRMKRAAFLATWPLATGPGESTLVRLRLEPDSHAGRAAPAPAASRFTAADYAQHIMALKRKIPAEGFTVVITPPFVVIGDDPPQEVRRRAKDTVKWAVDKLKEAYFAKDPDDILDIWLFKDKESYELHCKSIFHKAPDTPYGYFSHADRALVMNIATGGGTLVHEIVHPFVAANFPECPAWLNEGLGSLYEQSGEEDGRIHGYTNWRLGGLQEAIRKKRVPAFKALCSTTTEEFYQKDKGTNYAQARYLCYYLQQHELLQKFYRRFHAECKTDPTGYNTLKTVLGRTEQEMAAFQQEWEDDVLKLRFR
jgi:hypothetical protein